MTVYKKQIVQSDNNPNSFEAIAPVHICDVCGCEIDDMFYVIKDIEICDYCYDTAETQYPENTYCRMCDFE